MKQLVRSVLVGFAVAASTLQPRAFQAQGIAEDSVQVRRNAQRSQTHFENVRRANLPVRYGPSPQQCDARIGRFCQWNSDERNYPAEPRRITAARGSLLRDLESAAAALPRDGWISGQRVRYLLEAGSDTAALQVARACAAERWWCAALRGLAFHELDAFAEADTAFREALSLMPDQERCRWTDISLLLDAQQRKRYRSGHCGAAPAVTRHIWWLADPLLADVANDRETEHYARHTMSRILENTRAGYDARWGTDLRELLIRYGWARIWTRSPGTSSEPRGGPVSGHEATPNFHFLPRGVGFDSLEAITDTVWQLRYQTSSERYSPSWAEYFGAIQPQIAVFRRGDSLEVIAVHDVSADTAFATEGIRSALVASGAPGQQPRIAFSDAASGWTRLTLPRSPHLLSVEVWHPERRSAARTRTGLSVPQRKPGEIAVSDLLLYEARGDAVPDLDSALQSALGRLSVERSGKLGLYWEIYGLARADSVLPVTLTLTRAESGVLRRLAESIGLARRSTPLVIGWRETPRSDGVSTRAVALDLQLIPRGTYAVRVEVARPGMPPATTERVLEVR